MRLAFAGSAAIAAVCLLLGATDRARAECPVGPGTLPHASTQVPDSFGFPDSANNCNFHQWSWQMFLWLTQTVAPNTPRFATFLPSQALLPPALGGGPALNPFIGRSTVSRPLTEHVQAGPDGVLVDQNGRIVYYEMLVNPMFAEFVKANNLNDPATLRAFPATTPFPVGATDTTVELKVAWKILGTGDKAETFFTKTAQVALLTTDAAGKIIIDGDKTQQVQLGLVGFHIGGIVQHHPEMIWASFEHVSNAPDAPNGLQTPPDTIVSTSTFSFYKAGTPFKDCNVNAGGAGALKLVDPATQVLSPPTQVCRIYPQGGGKDTNIANIKDLNAAVRGGLDDVWKNYFEVGAIWFNTEGGKPGLQPNCTFVAGSPFPCNVEVTGSLHLSNATIETFTQVQSVQDNCFACHNTMPAYSANPRATPLPGKDLSISHIILDNYFAGAGR